MEIGRLEIGRLGVGDRAAQMVSLGRNDRENARARSFHDIPQIHDYVSKTTRPSITTSEGLVVASAPPGSTGSSSAAAGMMTTSAR